MATSAEIRQQLVTALRLDLIVPDAQERARSQEHLAQPPLIWYATGFQERKSFSDKPWGWSGVRIAAGLRSTQDA